MVTVGYTISALAALVVVGVLYYPLAFIFGIDSYGSLTAYCTQSFFAPTFDNINTQVSVENQIVVMTWQWRGQLLAWGSLLWMQSLFVLGGTVWRKFAFVKTLGIALVWASSSRLCWCWLGIQPRRRSSTRPIPCFSSPRAVSA